METSADARVVTAPPASAVVPRSGVVLVGRDGQARVDAPSGASAAGHTEPPPPRPDQDAEFDWAGAAVTDPGSVIRRALAAAGLLKP
jgi:hypothetical protein